MKIGVLSQWFPPESMALVWSLCTELTERGHEVRALTGYPNYPTGTIFPGYRQRWRHVERIGPVDVRRVPLFPSHDANPARRAATFLSFAASSTAACGFLRGCDVVYVYATPVTAAAAAAALRMLRGVPYVLHVQDLWPDSVTESGMIGGGRVAATAARLIDRLLAGLYARAGHVIAIAPTMARALEARGAPAGRTSVVLNWAADEEVPTAAPDAAMRARLGRPEHTIAVYAGNIGTVQDLDTVVVAAGKSAAAGVALDVAVVGSGARRAQLGALIAETAAPNVRLLDPVPRAEMATVYASADFQLVTLKDRPVFRGTVPSKLPSALARGCPIITTVAGDVTTMCREGGFGFAAEPERADSLTEAFTRAAASTGAERAAMAGAARSFYRSHMSQAASVAAIDGILARTARSSRRQP